ncbi:MAG: glutathione S-transferase family protein [Alphaproteobacteria bacterium]|nr:glutathione S-transferase family protein [Alphaproteobacteria bacterium]
MAKLKIHGIARSRAFRTLWIAGELGIAHEQVQTNWNDGTAKAAGFLKVNPMGQVPAIDDDGFGLSESMAINLYLAKKHGKGLYPSDLKDEAKCWQWSFFAATSLERSMGLVVANRYTLPPEKRSEAQVQENLEALKRPLAVLDAELGRAPYLLGQSFTVADLSVAAVLYGAWFNKHDFSGTPKIAAWLERCLTRPACLSARKLREAA